MSHGDDMQQLHGEYVIDDDRGRLDMGRVHAWMASTYWSPNIARDIVDRAADGSSMVVGVYGDGGQVGYLRVISDRATFAYIADVFVDEAHRRRGIASAMVRFALDHPEFNGLRSWLLMTDDAHEVYGKCGFRVHPYPDRIMMHRPGGWPAAPPQES